MSGINFDGVYITDIFEYKRKSNIIKKLIDSTYPSLEIIYTQTNDKDMVYVQIGNVIKFGIFPDHTWKEIKEMIDQKLSPTHNNTFCNVCSNKIIINASCPLIKFFVSQKFL
jgi:hypothetical protein